jgi:hypothetical protein
MALPWTRRPDRSLVLGLPPLAVVRRRARLEPSAPAVGWVTGCDSRSHSRCSYTARDNCTRVRTDNRASLGLCRHTPRG